jgi:drug/metabolite transporter (DMT)-like permease
MAGSIGLVVVTWAVNFIAAKIGLRYLPAVTMASFRVAIAGLFMVPAYFVCSRLPAFGDARRARERGFTLRDLWTFLYLGFFGVVVNQMCFTMGLRYTSVGHAAVIVGMGPIYTLVLAVLFRLERATWHKVVGMAIAFAGVAVLASENGISPRSPSRLGDAITMTGSIGFATYAVLGKRVAGRYDALTMAAFNHFAGAILILPVALHQARALGPFARWRAVPLARVDGAAVHGAVQLGSGVHFLFLAAAVFGGFAVGGVYVFAAGAGGDPGDCVVGRARVRSANCGWRIGAGRCVLGGVGSGAVGWRGLC